MHQPICTFSRIGVMPLLNFEDRSHPFLNVEISYSKKPFCIGITMESIKQVFNSGLMYFLPVYTGIVDTIIPDLI